MKKLKRILGLCDSPGCLHQATQLLRVRDSTGKEYEIKLCVNCDWKLEARGTRYEWDNF